MHLSLRRNIKSNQLLSANSSGNPTAFEYAQVAPFPRPASALPVVPSLQLQRATTRKNMLQKRTVLLLLGLIAISEGQGIGEEIRQALKPLQNLGQEITQQVQEDLRGLDNLGSRINQQVYEELEPVRVMQSMMSVRFGTGGTTVATFAPSGRQLIVVNGEYFECNGQIDSSKGECGGTLDRVKFAKDADFCYVTSRSVINDWYCLAPNSNFRIVSTVNGKITCETRDNSPRLLIERAKFHEMCKNLATAVTYTHFAVVPLKHIGNEMRCSGEHPQICSFSEPLTNTHNSITIISNAY